MTRKIKAVLTVAVICMILQPLRPDGMFLSGQMPGCSFIAFQAGLVR